MTPNHAIQGGAGWDARNDTEVNLFVILDK
jgi:hypothetical protein